MLIFVQKQRGFSLIELMIAVAIFAILLSVGLPAFSLWIQNTQNRTAAESILNGLQLARVEAIKRNNDVRFDLLDAAGTTAWNVGCVTTTPTVNCPLTIQSRPANEGSANARAGISTATPAGPFNAALASGAGLPAGVTFDFLGRVQTANAAVYITRVDIINVTNPAVRRMVITIGIGGAIRMCDPAVTLANNPQGCS